MNHRALEDPWLSVIIPSYRGERWIATALKSLIGDADPGVEVIVVDGGPTPAARNIAASYSDRLQLRIIEREDLRSWHTKTNFGVQLAKASHACWLGVDDIWIPGRCSSVRRWLTVAADLALHLAPAAVIGREGQKLGVWRCPLPSAQELAPKSVTQKLLVQNFVAAPAPVFRKDAWLETGGLDENLWYTADWDMWLKLASRGPLYYHDEVTVGFRVHSDSLTMAGRYNARDFTNQQQVVLERHLASLGDGTKNLERAARASIAVNTALASASTGDFTSLARAASRILGLGPAGICRYMHTSRIWERAVPRIRAKLTRAL
jgi:glycosyltransferase involved in cell wall biosynthesis